MLFLSPGVPTCLPPDPESRERHLTLCPSVPTCLPPDPESRERHLTLCPSGLATLVSSGFLSGLQLLFFFFFFKHLFIWLHWVSVTTLGI